jgi:hypothetical protein
LTRHRFAVLVLLVIPLASGLWYLLDVLSAYSQESKTTSMTVSNFDNRFRGLHKALPPRSVLGYVSDNVADDAEAQEEFYLTEYALTPAIVKGTSEEHLVVANLHTLKIDPAQFRAKHLERLQDFGNDVFLFINTTK